MSVFISHSFQDKAEFDNVAEALEERGIVVWKPEEMMAGGLLSEKLRQSVVNAELCVFVATRHSVESNWCGAELGAFWGAQKPVIIYMAESSLGGEALPGQFKGHLFERRIRRVVDTVEACLEKTRAAPTPDVGANTLSLAEMSSEDLKTLISEAVGSAQSIGFAESTLFRLDFAVPSDGKVQDSEMRHLQELLLGLLGMRSTVLREAARRTEWKHGFEFSTDTGHWLGLGKHYENPDKHRGNAPVDMIYPCLVWRVGDDQLVEGIALLSSATDHYEKDIVNLGMLIAIVGRGSLGSLQVKG
jgi:hypothetical protein